MQPSIRSTRSTPLAHRLIAAAAAAVALGAVPLAASAVAAVEPVTDIELSYTITGLGLPEGYAGTIYDIAIFNRYEFSSGAAWPTSVPASGGTITDVFRKSSTDRPLSALMIGLIDNLPGDGSAGQTHLVMMVADGAASALKNIAWGTSFPTVLEANLIADVHTAFGTTRGEQTPEEQWDAAFGNVASFVDDHNELWFPLAVTTPGTTNTSTFSVMAWSDGVQIGSGVASVTQAVPEPQTWLLMFCGLAAVGATLRRRTQA